MEEAKLPKNPLGKPATLCELVSLAKLTLSSSARNTMTDGLWDCKYVQQQRSLTGQSALFETLCQRRPERSHVYDLFLHPASQLARLRGKERPTTKIRSVGRDQLRLLPSRTASLPLSHCTILSGMRPSPSPMRRRIAMSIRSSKASSSRRLTA
jgi:hypothetical protein